jgi:hypothetical protein
MQLRWIAILSVWTLLAGPIFDASGPSSKSRVAQDVLAAPAKVTPRK